MNKTMMPIADLHCDLLSYLEVDQKRTAKDSESQCSIPNFKEGGVVFQTLAIYSETKKGSTDTGQAQFKLFKKLLLDYPGDLFPFDKKKISKNFTTICLAIENASAVAEEEGESLDVVFSQLEKMQKEAGTILYLSLTWNRENRFGGGSATKIGLKKDGEKMLDFLDGRGIAIDFSHTSDLLAQDVLDYIDKKKLNIQMLASHSNFRKIADVPRNLPDDIAKEIVNRGGVIGINFFRSFVGKEIKDFLRHIEYGLDLLGKDALCFGADFFPEIDSGPHLDHLRPLYFPEFRNSGTYPQMIALLKKDLSEEIIKSISYTNFERFISRSLSLDRS